MWIADKAWRQIDVGIAQCSTRCCGSAHIESEVQLQVIRMRAGLCSGLAFLGRYPPIEPRDAEPERTGSRS